MSFPEASIPEEESIQKQSAPKNQPAARTIAKHTLLFIVTFACITFVGMFFWVGQTANVESYWEMLPEGALFAGLLLAFLGTHEFGHYFAAVKHNVRVTLPYFIPIPFGIGTMGAVIRIQEVIKNTRKLFDIGISGPIAGFIVSLVILIYGFSTLPEPAFIENFAGHEEIANYIQETGNFPEVPPETSGENTTIFLGKTLLFSFIASFFDNVPPMYELYHYPFLFAGWLGLFFTALNLMPIGQLDGGHILYSLIGFKKHRTVARISFGFIATLGGIEAIPFLYDAFTAWHSGMGYLSLLVWAIALFFLLRKAFNNDHTWIAPVWALSLAASAGYLFLNSGGINQSGSLIWVVWSFFLVYFVKMEHPPVAFEENLTPVRKWLGWISMGVFILCISPAPIYYFN